MRVSVVIASRNRSVLLGRTLRALAAQRWPADQMDMIVADNGSTDDTRVVVEQYAADGLPVRYIYVVEPGKCICANRGVTWTRRHRTSSGLQQQTISQLPTAQIATAFRGALQALLLELYVQPDDYAYDDETFARQERRLFYSAVDRAQPDEIVVHAGA
jgi:glycosyltransferase involved in cell wall biosynthesis